MEENKQAKTIEISKRAIVMAVAIVLVLVIAAYILTFVLPKGEYQRDATGAIIQGTYAENPELEGISFWKFLLSPVMVLSPSVDGSEIVYVILALLLVIGAVFTALDECGILIYMVNTVACRFGQKKYALLFFLSFVFMFLGSAVGMFEEFIPLVPVVVLLCYAMGWDALVGLGISILAGCFGFSAGVVNPFTVGVSQTIGGLEMFSGIGPRLLTFAVGYLILMAFVYPYAKKVEKNPQHSPVYMDDLARKAEFNFSTEDFVRDPARSHALVWFACWICLIILISIISIFWTAIAQYVMYITVAVYVISGVGAAMICGVRGRRLAKCLGKGMLSLLPAIVMVMVACGVRYIIVEGDIMDTVLHMAIQKIDSQSTTASILWMYLTIFLFEIFIPSGSAKAMLIMPTIFDICTVVGINKQVAVLALTFGDGFSNVLLPTNAGLLLILGLTTVDYRKWLRWSGLIQLTMLAATIVILLLSNYVFYA